MISSIKKYLNPYNSDLLIKTHEGKIWHQIVSLTYKNAIEMIFLTFLFSFIFSLVFKWTFNAFSITETNQTLKTIIDISCCVNIVITILACYILQDSLGEFKYNKIRKWMWFIIIFNSMTLSLLYNIAFSKSSAYAFGGLLLITISTYYIEMYIKDNISKFGRYLIMLPVCLLIFVIQYLLIDGHFAVFNFVCYIIYIYVFNRIIKQAGNVVKKNYNKINIQWVGFITSVAIYTAFYVFWLNIIVESSNENN